MNTLVLLKPELLFSTDPECTQHNQEHLNTKLIKQAQDRDAREARST